MMMTSIIVLGILCLEIAVYIGQKYTIYAMKSLLKTKEYLKSANIWAGLDRVGAAVPTTSSAGETLRWIPCIMISQLLREEM